MATNRATATTPAIVAVVGETSSGKSGLALELARRFDGELICADSRTIYKGMDVGTAKPTAAEQAEVPHHLLDVVAPGEQFTAADFKVRALAAIADIAARGKLPILVGGTGLYVDAVLFDYQFGRQADPAHRSELAQLSLAELRALAATKGLMVDPEEANKRYIIRTIERGGAAGDDRQQLRAHTLVIGLQLSRNTLRRRIEQRVEQMFRRGLRKEVEELRARYGWDSEALTGIGYREFRPYYDGQASMSEVKRQIVQNTLQLAKRQRTWFRRNPHIVWCEAPEQAIEQVQNFLQQKDVKQG